MNASKKPRDEWFQDNKTVTVRLEVRNTSAKNIDVELADLVLKINVLDKKLVKTWDLAHEVDFLSKENSTV